MLFSELSLSKKYKASHAQQACFFYFLSAAAFAAFFLPKTILINKLTLNPCQ